MAKPRVNCCLITGYRPPDRTLCVGLHVFASCLRSPYIYSAFNQGHQVGSVGFQAIDQAFVVPAGHVVYIGNFVLDGDRVTLHRELDGEHLALTQALPMLGTSVEAAAAVTATPARPFMCAP